MTFQLDTTGEVLPNMSAKPPLLYAFRWDDLSPFAQGYVEALFATVAEETNKEWGHCTLLLRFSDLAPETLARAISDCERRISLGGGWHETKVGGAVFWSLRQRDHQLAFPLLTVRLGDDGRVRFAS